MIDSLVGCLRQRADERPSDTALICLSARSEARFDYATLDQRARALAAVLQARFVPGERAMLLLDNDDHYVVAFFACLYAGLIAVPAYPLSSIRKSQYSRLASIAADCTARCVLATTQALANRTEYEALFPQAELLAIDTVDAQLSSQWRERMPQPSEIAFLQYTSGSTGSPKGVVIDHGCLMANEQAICEAFAVQPHDLGVSWLPLFHDMGLIGGVLQPIYSGVPVVLMTPRYFLEKPVRWLQAMSTYKATGTGGPNFAFRMCVDRIREEQLQDLDLSKWRLAFTGSEPIDAATLRAFIELLAPTGFKPTALLPCYGLAEATVFVSAVKLGTGLHESTLAADALARNEVVPADQGVSFPSCGVPARGHAVRIMSPDGLTELPERQVGEVQVCGPSVARGYWERSRESAEVFIERDGRRWVRTGDLGFIRHGELYITGRQKDLIIVRGQNLYPQDIEGAVETDVPSVRGGRVAAFPVAGAGGTEGIGIAVEVARLTQKATTGADLAQQVRMAVLASCGETPALIVLLQPGELPRTSSGKLQRAACREGVLNGSLQSYHLEPAHDEPRMEVLTADLTGELSPSEREVSEIWSEVLGCMPSSRDDHFFALGGTSIAVAQVLARVRERLGAPLDLRDLFEAPLLGEFAARVAAGRNRAGADAVIPQIERTRSLALSPAQQRMWFHWQLEPSSSAYIISGVAHLRGALTAASLQAAFDSLVQRHESLRTRFAQEGDHVHQIIDPQGINPLAFEDLRWQPELLQTARLRERAAREVGEPFDLCRGPLLRVRLLQLADDRFALIVSAHHIIADGWSINLLIEEVCELHEARHQNREPRLAALPIQYADFASWRLEWLRGEAGARQLTYWKQRLGDQPESGGLLLDRPRSDTVAASGAECKRDIDASLRAALKALALRHRSTVPMVLLGALIVLIGRHTREHDIRIGTTVANRMRSETERLIGFFVNMLVLRVDISDRPTFASLLERVRSVSLDSQAHQDLPFERLVEELAPERRSGENPLFQIAYDHQWLFTPTSDPNAALHIEAIEPTVAVPQFDLTVHTVETPTQLQARFCYRSDLLERATMERMADQWLALLRAVAEDAMQPIDRLPLASAAELRQAIVLCNERARPSIAIARTESLCERFEAQVRERPHALALTFHDDHMTYAELNRRANRLAWKLRRLGVGPDKLVALAAQRNPWLVVGVLAVLKAGGAYLPLDPALPRERLQYLLEDSGATVLLASAALPPLGYEVTSLRRVALDEVTDEDSRDDNPPANITARNLAYCIYTSGSTGRPKGVTISHANVIRLFDAADADFAFGASDVWTLFHAYSFDFSVWELFGALLYGGRLVIVPYHVSRSAEEFLTLLQRERVTILNQTPTAFRQLVAALRDRPLDSSLREIIFGGETLEPHTLQPWFDRFGDASPRLVNMYGITETTVHVSFRPLSAEDAKATRSPIGVPLADLHWYLLDESLEPVPQGVVGEICVAGAGLARGYLRRPALTAERFVPDPFSEEGGRLYRSGDLARLHVDGSIEYLGRIDQQVKVRGHRIELGEIAATLREHQAVRDAVVIATADQTDGQRLLAYVVSEPAALAASTEDLTDTAQRVEQWQGVFDDTYGTSHAPSFIGWNDSFTDQPIALTQMQSWRDHTVARIVALQPRRLLEIGCGVGLLTERLAPVCEIYRGTDVSPRAVAGLTAWASTQPQLRNVHLSCQEATDFEGIEAGAFDTIVLNSVAQYFPDAAYLVRVLAQAAARLDGGGHIFIGDVRNLDWLELFHTAVQLERAPASLSTRALRQRIARALEQERELALSPAFFSALATELPGLSSVQIALKPGDFDNELTRYRYDVVLHVGGPDVAPVSERLPWQADQGEASLLEAVTHRAATPDTFRVEGLFNRRLSREVYARELLHGGDVPATVAALRERLQQLPPRGIDVDSLVMAARRSARTVHLAASSIDGQLTLELLDAGIHGSAPSRPTERESWRRYVNDPARARRRQALGRQLRETLRERLPDYMVPAHILPVDALPLTSNGKLDRTALPEPDQGSAGQLVAPQGEIEVRLARLFSEVLGVERVSRNDNFFDLGGHSLAASALIARVRQAWSDRAVVDMPLRTVFTHPTLHAFAARVAELLQDVAAAALPPLVPVPRTAAMRLSPAQLRLWLVDQLLERDADRAAYNMAARLRITGRLSLPALRDSFAQLIRRHEVLRTAYPQGADGEPVAVISSQVPIDIPFVDLADVDPAQREQRITELAQEHAERVFSLESAPLLRLLVLRTAPEEHLLLVNMHHLISDGWSVGVLVDDFVDCYRAAHDGVQPPLRTLPVQYVDYAEWQHRLWDAERLAREASFWQGYLHGAPTVPVLPADRPRPAVASHAGASLRFMVPATLRDRLLAIGKAHDATLFVTLLATLQALVHHSSGRDNVIIGTDVAGRAHADLEGLVGFFVNVLPLRSRLRSDMSFKDLLGATRDGALAAFEHQALPFDKVVEVAGVERDRRWNPLVQILFVLQNAPQGRFDIPGLSIEMLPALEVRSKFDLAVFVSEQAQGLEVEWVYASALFERRTIEDLASSWQQLMERVLAHPDAPLVAAPSAKRSSAARENKLDKLNKILARPSTDRSPSAPVRTSRIEGHLMPLVVEPSARDLDPWRWAAANRDFVEQSLCSHAAVLFRGFSLVTPQDFEAFAEALEPALHGSYGDLPKKEGARNLYRSTPYPNEQMILFHNESSHLSRWPRKQLFFCEHPGDHGGATPIVDGREMMRRLPRALVETFERKELLYVRTFTSRLDVSWQDFFKTDSRAVVEAQLRASHIAWQWLEEDALQTRARCPAVITHPRTGERVFFNQLQLHHVGCLDAQVRDDLLSMVPMERLPRHVYYGDGSPIDDETLAIVGRTYEQCAVRFPWRRGDVLMLDNMLAAHARDPYEGPRKIVVAMGAMFERASLPVLVAATDEVPA